MMKKMFIKNKRLQKDIKILKFFLKCHLVNIGFTILDNEPIYSNRIKGSKDLYMILLNTRNGRPLCILIILYIILNIFI